jgi:hypothetical protein
VVTYYYPQSIPLSFCCCRSEICWGVWTTFTNVVDAARLRTQACACCRVDCEVFREESPFGVPFVVSRTRVDTCNHGRSECYAKEGRRRRSFIQHTLQHTLLFFVQHTTLAVDYASLQNIPCTTWSIYTSIYIYSNMNSARLSNYERRESLQNLTHVQFIHIFHSTYVFESTHPPKSTYIFPPTRSIHVQFTQRAPHHENPTKQKEEHNNTPEPRTQKPRQKNLILLPQWGDPFVELEALKFL